MKKVVATCIYTHTDNIYRCWNFTVNHNGNNITLIQYDVGDTIVPYGYKSLNDMYSDLLDILKGNNFCTVVTTQFGCDWYNIQFIELGTTIISKFGHRKEN